LDRAFPSEGKGRPFESGQAHHKPVIEKTLSFDAVDVISFLNSLQKRRMSSSMPSADLHQTSPGGFKVDPFNLRSFLRPIIIATFLLIASASSIFSVQPGSERTNDTGQSATSGVSQESTAPSDSKEIRGRIKDVQGQPLEYVTITASSIGVKTFSNDHGEFTIHLPAAAGQIRLLFELPGYYSETLVYERKDQAAEIEVSLTPVKIVREEVIVMAPRLDIPLNATPAATTLVEPDTLDAMPRSVAIDETLRGVPGVKVDNQANGERVHMSIRGQGILTERGVRGIQVLLDGLPLNDPTGFVPDLFDVDWAGVQEMEVVRGPLAFLYGGGSAGGVIDIRTHDASDTLHGTLWTSGGSNGFYKGRGELSGAFSRGTFVVAASRNAGNGYRDHSAFWSDNAYGKLSLNVTPRLRLNAILMGTGFFNQNAEGLNLTWLNQDRRMANPDALTYNEFQKTVRVTGGLTGQWTVSENQRVSFTFYSRWTQYDEPVPSSVDHRTLFSPGGSSQYDLERGSGRLKHHLSLGFDLDGQFIDDHRHPNLGNAVEGSSVLANQSITQNRAAGYVTDRVGLGSQWTLLLSVRLDRIGNRLEDHLRLNGLDLSGDRVFTHGTGRVGVNWNPKEQIGLFASWGQGFLPPATEELYANPAALGGFNRALIPATSSGAEVGVRGRVRNHFYYDATVFRLDTKNDFERYRITDRPLETFYRNAGQSRRYGLETSFKWLPVHRLTLSTAYTYSHFIYAQYNSLTYPGDLTGNRLPNSPAHQFFADATFDFPRNVSLSVSTMAYSRAYIDATNQTWIDGYGLLDARLSKTWQRRKIHSTVFVHGKNLTGTKYIAFTEPDPDGNSYQPGPEREVFVGVQLRF
jgi:iron complex outermembrane receptor protein